jgi:phosphomannomutase
VVPDQLNKEVILEIGRRFSLHFSSKTVVVGSDMRLTSPELKESLISGLISGGSDVIDIGLVSTPMLYFAVPFLKADAGIMVTASHNPLNYNGLKFCDGNAHPIFKENGLLKLLEEIAIGDKSSGVIKKYDIKSDYINFVKTHLGGVKGSFALDAMWGTNSLLIKDVFTGSDIKAEFISAEVDGNVPGYKSPNPLIKQNQDRVIGAIKDKGCDLGFMWDGDGDRLLVFDDKARFVSPHIISFLISDYLLKKNSGAAVVCDLRTSSMVRDLVEEKGGKYYQAKAGNPYVKDVMREVGAIFGAETSGHYMFKESNFAEDTILATIFVIKAVESKGLKLSEIVDEMESKYFIMPETNFRVEDSRAVFRGIENIFPEAEKDYLDGLTIRGTDWWANIRSSNTEPLIRLNMEACSKKRLDEVFEKISLFIDEIGGTRSDH